MRGAIVAAILVAGLAGLGPAAAPAARADTLEAARERGYVTCGTTRSGIGVAEIDPMGVWRGFFPDFCRALAAAVLGDAEAVEFVEVDYVIRFDALNSGAFDVLMANTTWTVSRDARHGLSFTNILYYDGQGFLGHRSLGVDTLAGLDAGTVCVHDGTTTVRNLEELIADRFPNLSKRVYESIDGVYESFFARECDLMTQDRVALISQRQNRAANPDDYVLFDDIVSKEPLGPAVRGDDQRWEDIVRWVANALILAEEHGIGRDTVAAARESARVQEVRRLLGLEGDIGPVLGLDPDWAYRAIRQVGSYGDVFERNLGPASGLNVARGDRKSVV